MHKEPRSYYITLDEIMNLSSKDVDFSGLDEEDQIELAKTYLDHDNKQEKEDALDTLQEIAADNAIEYVGMLARGMTKEVGEYLLKAFTKSKWLTDKINYDMDMINLRPDHKDQPEK